MILNLVKKYGGGKALTDGKWKEGEIIGDLIYDQTWIVEKDKTAWVVENKSVEIKPK